MLQRLKAKKLISFRVGNYDSLPSVVVINNCYSFHVEVIQKNYTQKVMIKVHLNYFIGKKSAQKAATSKATISFLDLIYKNIFKVNGK